VQNERCPPRIKLGLWTNFIGAGTRAATIFVPDENQASSIGASQALHRSATRQTGETNQWDRERSPFVGGAASVLTFYFMHYNYCRIHKTLRVTPAMEAGLTDHVWTIEELCGLIPEKKPIQRIDAAIISRALRTA